MAMMVYGLTCMGCELFMSLVEKIRKEREKELWVQAMGLQAYEELGIKEKEEERRAWFQDGLGFRNNE